MSRYQVELHEEAEADAREAYLYYRRGSRRTAAAFQVRLDQAIEELSEAAHQYQVIRDNIRRVPMEQFPHGLMYEIIEDSQVMVYAVVHPR